MGVKPISRALTLTPYTISRHFMSIQNLIIATLNQLNATASHVYATNISTTHKLATNRKIIEYREHSSADL